MSNFVVSARKYRPMRFDEVVGQEHISQTLKNAFKSDHLAHAFLFCGPRGVGKTTSARILAKVLNCENVTEDFEPCNECGSCKAFNDNASFNITELDAASNNSVEHIRALIEQVRFQPQQGRYKIYIIDEVHMLSQQAFNAFLKTLEEPPPYAKFILATTEKHKIIPTILSRCQIFDFNRIQIPDTVAHLQSICDEEGIQAEPDALHIIAQKADGALRDALSIFDRIVSFSSDRITYEDVIQNLNVLDYDYFFRILDAMLAEDVRTVLLAFDEVLRKGFDPSLFINGFAEHLRNILVCKDAATLALLEVGESLQERYREQAAIAPMSFLLAALNLANDCDVHYKMARNKRLHVEMALIKMTYLNRAVQASTLVQTVAPPAGTEKKNTPPVSSAPTSSLSANAATPASAATSTGNADAPSVTPIRRKAKPSKLSLDAIAAEVAATEAANQAAPQETLTLEALQTWWAAYVEGIESPTTRTAFKSATLTLHGSDILIETTSAFTKGSVQQERELLPQIRTHFKRDDLTLKVEVSAAAQQAAHEAQAAAAPPRSLSARDKFLLMRQSNPLVDDLRKRFDLRPE